jgi:hypothetical protein
MRFVTGLALLALMFGGPAAVPASAVDTSTGTTTTATTGATSAGSTATAIETGAAVVQHQTECHHDGSGIARSVPAADRAAPAGVAAGAHGSRAPPRS